MVMQTETDCCSSGMTTTTKQAEIQLRASYENQLNLSEIAKFCFHCQFRCYVAPKNWNNVHTNKNITESNILWHCFVAYINLHFELLKLSNSIQAAQNCSNACASIFVFVVVVWFVTQSC